MGMTQGAELVLLESQTKILNGLQKLTHSQSNIIYVEGESGAGKSWLAQRFLNTDKEIQTLSFLICLKSQTAAQQRSVLMSQLLSDSLCTGEETLVESLQAYRKDQQCNATIIVDDANLLAPHLIDELCELVQVSQQSHAWQINVILFAASSSLDDHLLNKMGQSGIKSLVLQPLTDAEAKLFLEQLVIPHCKTNKERTNTYQTATKIENWPGDLLALKPSSKHHASPWVRTLLVGLIIILLAMGGWSWWASYQANTQSERAASNNQSQLASSSQDTSDSTHTVSSEENSELTEADANQQNSFSSDNNGLPPAVTSETITVGDSEESDQQRVLVPSDVVDALMDGDDPTETSSSRQNNATSPQNASNASITLANDELMSVSPERYTLQLATFPNKSDTLYFIQSYKLQDKVRVYQTIRNQKPWYVITYQDFETISDSREAVKQFSTELQAELPRPKPMEQVQQEIHRAQ